MLSAYGCPDRLKRRFAANPAGARPQMPADVTPVAWPDIPPVNVRGGGFAAGAPGTGVAGGGVAVTVGATLGGRVGVAAGAGVAGTLAGAVARGVAAAWPPPPLHAAAPTSAASRASRTVTPR